MAEDWSYGLILGDQRIPIVGEQVVLGRSRSCDVPISDPSISRKHARLLAAGAELVVQDLGSSNGTLVNGQPTHDRTVLRHGDRLSLGDSTLVVEIVPVGVTAAAQAGDATAFLQNRSIELAKKVEKASGGFDAASLEPVMPGTADPAAPADPLGTIRLSAVAAEDLQAAVEQETAITTEPVIDPLRTMRLPAGGLADVVPETPAPAAPADPAADDPRKTVHISADEILASVAESREAAAPPDRSAPPASAAPRPGPRLDETRATVRPGSLPADGDDDELSLGNPALATLAMDVDALLEPSPRPAPSSPPVAPSPSPPAVAPPVSSPAAPAPPLTASLSAQTTAAAAVRPPPASFLARVAAAVIDLGWAIVLGVGMAFALGVADEPRGWQLAALATLPLVALVVTIGWSVWGTSPGKRLLNLYVCTVEGRPGIGLLRAMIRAAGYLLTALTLGIGFLLAAFGERRALHDRIAGTYVARLP